MLSKSIYRAIIINRAVKVWTRNNLWRLINHQQLKREFGFKISHNRYFSSHLKTISSNSLYLHQVRRFSTQDRLIHQGVEDWNKSFKNAGENPKTDLLIKLINTIPKDMSMEQRKHYSDITTKIFLMAETRLDNILYAHDHKGKTIFPYGSKLFFMYRLSNDKA